jgi:hypothetical protein
MVVVPMALSINLRGDLAKLSDAELAGEFERLLAERPKLSSSISWLERMAWQSITWPWIWIGRGPLRARIFYRLIALDFGQRKNNLIDLHYPSALHLLDCELKDVRDEIQRRVDAKPKSSKASR